MSAVSFQHIFKQYSPEAVAVKDLNLEIRDGEFMVLVGPSGCGKTTALRMLAGLEEVTAGEISIGDRVVNDVSAKDRDIAMVFQNYALYPHMSVYENMAFGLKLRKVPRADIRRRVDEAAALLGIESFLHRKPKALSGGQRQRVALGRAIVREPQVFLMDEPLSNLDAKLRVQTRAELIKLHRRLGITTVYVTHDQVEAMTMGDRIAVMREGVLQQCAPPLEIYQHPANMFVAGFIGTPSMNFLNATIQKNSANEYSINCGDFKLAIPPHLRDKIALHLGKSVVVGVRPSDIFDKNLKNTIESTPENTIPTQVDVSEPMGDTVLLYLKAGAQQIIASINADTLARDGQNFDAVFNLNRLHLFDAETEIAL